MPVFETGSHVSEADFELLILQALAPNTRMAGLCYYAQHYFFFKVRVFLCGRESYQTHNVPATVSHAGVTDPITVPSSAVMSPP